MRRVERELEGVPAGVSGSVVDKGAVQVVVVEWSCALDGASWERYSGHEREELHRRFGRVQGQRWREKAGGSYFWTAKSECLHEEWHFPTMLRRGAVTVPENLRLSFHEVITRCGKAHAQKQQHKRRAVEAHTAYWDRAAPDTQFEHWRFIHGWEQGFMDATDFFQMRAVIDRKGDCGGDSIGMLEVWILIRMREAGQEGAFAWEWEHGFRQGVKAFESIVMN